MVRYALIVLLMLLTPLSALAVPIERWSFDTVARVQPLPTLLASYDIKPLSGTPNYQQTRYVPRGFATGFVYEDAGWGKTTVVDAASYTGWDFHPTLNYGIQRFQSTPNWFTFVLTRDATVAVVWRGGTTVPSWLNGWERAGDVKATWTYPSGTIARPTYPVYRKVFVAGEVALGGVNNPGVTTARDTYWVLLAEADGTPSTAPAVPAEFDVPVPNQACPTWLHDLHTTVGPNQKTYATWHPMIDPVYWCSYRHEHGSDPDHFDAAWEPAFGYATEAMGMTEPHAGFKVYVFDHNGYRWGVVHHFGTASLGRACQPHHGYQITIKHIETNQILADMQFVADFGTATPTNEPYTRLTPSNCPTQGTTPITGARRMIPHPGSGTGNGYEPWTFASPLPILGFTGTITINTRDPIVVCSAVPNCDVPLVTGNSGSTRFVSPTNGFGWSDPGNGALFCTDPHGRVVLDCAQPNAVQQRVLVGASAPFGAISSGFHCVDNGWGRAYECGYIDRFVTANREDALRTGTDAQGRPTYGPN